MVFIHFSLKSGGNNLVVSHETVSRKCSYNFASEDRIETLKKFKLKKCTENKMNWGVNAYNDWHDIRLDVSV